MPEENVKIVRRIYSAWERGNFAEGRKLFDPEIVFESVMPDSSERIVAHGPEGIEAFTREFFAQWRDYRRVAEDFRQVGTQTVLVEGRQSGIGRQSGAAVENPIFDVWTFRSGKIVRLIIEFDRTKALEAAGLSE